MKIVFEARQQCLTIGWFKHVPTWNLFVNLHTNFVMQIKHLLNLLTGSNNDYLHKCIYKTNYVYCTYVKKNINYIYVWICNVHMYTDLFTHGYMITWQMWYSSRTSFIQICTMKICWFFFKDGEVTLRNQACGIYQ